MSTYFITGVTGVVGSAIAGALLAAPDMRLKLLIRAPSDAVLEERLNKVISFWGHAPDAVRGRVEALRGDTTLPRFGLEAARFERLARECSHLVHCAAIVRMTLPLDEARASAVGAAENVIELATLARRYGQLEKVEFLSTVGVGGRWSGPLPERWLTEPRRFHNTYEHAKAEAETVATRAVADGLPLTVHRPSMVVGDSRTGKIIHFQVFYHLVEFLSGTRTGGFFPPLDRATLDLIPVDNVANAVLWSSRHAETVGLVMHHCSGPQGAVPLVELRDKVRTLFSARGLTVRGPITVPAGVLRAAVPVLGLVLPGKLRRAVKTLPVFLDYLAEDQSFANAETQQRLAATGIKLPPVAEYLPRVLDYYLERRRAPDA